MSARLRILLADDEPLALRRLSLLLRDHDDVEVVGTAIDGDTALAEARRLKPDLLILDVEMPGLNGIAVAAALALHRDAEVVILSAFDRYAAPAFEIEALDYLLKPLRLERLRQALDRAQRRRAERNAHSMAQQEERDAEAASIHVPDRHGGYAVPLSLVTWVEAARDYAILHTARRSHMLRITMSDLAVSLPPSFMRVHRSAFVSVAEIRRWATPGRGVQALILSDGTIVGVGPSYLADVRTRLKAMAT